MARTLFTNRLGGASIGPFESKNLALHVGDSEVSVKANRKKLADEIGLSPEKIFYMNQVHGNQIAVIAGGVYVLSGILHRFPFMSKMSLHKHLHPQLREHVTQSPSSGILTE